MGSNRKPSGPPEIALVAVVLIAIVFAFGLVGIAISDEMYGNPGEGGAIQGSFLALGGVVGIIWAYRKLRKRR